MKKLSCLLVSVCILLLLSGIALASPRDEGKPRSFEPGQTRGYFIWQDGRELHLRTTTQGQSHVFSGVLHINGRLFDVEEKQLENGDYVRFDRDHNIIRFRFTTTGGTDGFDLKLLHINQIDFVLYRDGKKLPTKEIYIGSQSWHPKEHHFKLTM